MINLHEYSMKEYTHTHIYTFMRSGMMHAYYRLRMHSQTMFRMPAYMYVLLLFSICADKSRSRERRRWRIVLHRMGKRSKRRRRRSKRRSKSRRNAGG